MARARLISRTLGTSRCFAELGKRAGDLGEFAQALYPQLIVYSDDHGREHGDAFTIKHAVWPTSPRSEDEFERALAAMATDAVKLIYRYTVDGVTYFQIRAFEEHQKGLHKRIPSRFPKFPGNSGDSGKSAEKIRSRARAESESESETNRKEKKKEQSPAAARARSSRARQENLHEKPHPRIQNPGGIVPLWDWQFGRFRDALRPQFGDEAYAETMRWVDAVDEQVLNAKARVDATDPVKWWNARYAVDWSPPTMTAGRTAGNEAVLARFIARRTDS